MKKYLKLNYIKINQKKMMFFLCKMTPKQLYIIANENLSRYSNSEEGIQRELSSYRIKDIKKYLKTEDSTFPNAIIISISKNPANHEPVYILDESNNILSISEENGVANILDGQHRLSGFNREDETFELPVSVFLDLSLGEQAKIFSKINSTQAKVSLDLVYDLFGIIEGRSTEKSSYAIVKALNTEDNSPWKGKIKTLSDRSGDIAQGSFAKYIDKELIGDGKVLENLFKQDRDKDLLDMLKNFFKAVEDVFPKEWENFDQKYILTKTTGFVGFMNFFKDLIKISRELKREINFDFCKERVISSKVLFSDFCSDNYESGVKGQIKITNILREGLSEEEKSILKIK